MHIVLGVLSGVLDGIGILVSSSLLALNVLGIARLRFVVGL